MESVSVLIVENDLVQSDNLKQLLKRLNYEVVGAFTTGEEAVEKAPELMPDVVIMDIDLDGPMDGIEAANRIHENLGTPIIYLSHHEDLKTYRSARRNVRAEYMAKPLSPVNVLNAIENLLFKSREKEDEILPKINDRIFVKNGNGHFAVFLKDIIYIEANREVSVIHHSTSDKPSTVGVNLGTLEQKLKPFPNIVRCSRFHMVNLDKVTRIRDKYVVNPNTGKEALKKVLEVPGETLVISDKYRSQITSRFHMH